MTLSLRPTPNSLQRRGYVPFADDEAAESFTAFANWAEQIYAQPAAELPDLGSFYIDLRMGDEGTERPKAPTPTAVPFRSAWIDPSCYVASNDLLDGFFSDKHMWGEVVYSTIARRGLWPEIATSMRSGSGIFDEAAASLRMRRERIEVQRASDGVFMHSQSYGGRHRMMAMIALGAPSLPVLLRV